MAWNAPACTGRSSRALWMGSTATMGSTEVGKRLGDPPSTGALAGYLIDRGLRYLIDKDV